MENILKTEKNGKKTLIQDSVSTRLQILIGRLERTSRKR